MVYPTLPAYISPGILSSLKMSLTFEIVCYSCNKKFKTRRAYNKHWILRHDFPQPSEIQFVKEDDSVDVPKFTLIDISDGQYKEGYLCWLTGVAEQVNAAFHPNFPGKL